MSLRVRILALIALFAVILIGAFNALLITRQLAVISENNLYRARIGSFAAKGAFERTLLSALRTGEPDAAFQRLIPLLKEGQLAEEVLVADLQGKIVAAGREGLTGSSLTTEEAQGAAYARKTYSAKSWFHAGVEPSEVTFYAPITVDDVPQYIAIFRYSLGNMGQAISQAGALCVGVTLGVIAVLVPLALLLMRSILGPIQILNRATKDIAAGNLSQQVEVQTEDELGELAKTFNQMGRSLVAMKARAENANPLTKLPGNNVIHEEIARRIKLDAPFVAIYSDLDNFKAFNDKYGIAAGDKAIGLTAATLREAMRLGSSLDFLGHEGGDDFFILTIPEKAEAVTHFVTTEFDKRIKELYSPEDRERGYIISKDRDGNTKQFPLMTISLAGVTNAHRKLTSYAEVTNICAEVKKKAKMTSKEAGKSSFVLDHRSGQNREATAPKPEPHSERHPPA